jgi:acetyl esterase
MDPKAQIVGEFVKSIRVPGYFPPLPELRQQLRTMVTLMDEPAPPLPRVEDIRIPGPAGELPARIYAPQATGAPRPTVAYFHGGGWVQGDLETHHGLCARLAKHADVLVVAIDYRLAPEHKFPAAVDDCLAAYRWLRTHGRDVGADTTRVAVAGDSAGGNLAAVVSQLAARDGGPAPALQLLIYPATDFSRRRRSRELFGEGFLLTNSEMDWFETNYLGAERTHARDPRASPLLSEDLSGLAPAYVVTAAFDPLRDEGEEYAAALARAGTPVVLRRFPGFIHAFIAGAGVSRNARDALVEIAGATRALFAGAGRDGAQAA